MNGPFKATTRRLVSYDDDADPVVGIIKQMEHEAYTAGQIADHMRIGGGFNSSVDLEDYVLRVINPVN